MIKALKILIFVLAFNLGCVSYSLSNKLPDSLTIAAGPSSPLGEALKGHEDESGFLPLIEGSEAFDARVALANIAGTSLDVQYYIWHRDKTGTALLSKLLDAAERGVRVRLLLDDINLGKDREFLKALDQHPLVQIRIFNPLSSDGEGVSVIARNVQLVLDFNEMNRRMHNKVFIADNTAAVIGGRNIGDEYFDLKEDRSFRDLDILAAGKVTKTLSKDFDQYWNSPNAYGFHKDDDAAGKISPEEWQKVRVAQNIAHSDKPEVIFANEPKESTTAETIAEYKKQLIWAEGEAMADSPAIFDDKAPGLEDKIKKWPKPVSEFLVESAYFIPPEPLLNFFKELNKKGVTIKVLTNSLQSNDVMLAHAGYMGKRDEIMNSGAEMYEWRMKKVRVKTADKGGMYASRAGLHSKTFVIDRQYVFIGSMNLDGRSIDLNTESGMMIHSRELAKRISAFILEGMSPELSWKLSLDCKKKPCTKANGKLQWSGIKDGKQMTYDAEPEAPLWKRSMANFMSHLPIEDKL
jgi:putative cardiolipin synthase